MLLVCISCTWLEFYKLIFDLSGGGWVGAGVCVCGGGVVSMHFLHLALEFCKLIFDLFAWVVVCVRVCVLLVCISCIWLLSSAK